ncbi:hypothetical protein GOODEAATRI_027958 [Goodea atripinnis]|uniref:Uncharacterized protein n=1 Tax=Goodea atripinnis TaxID=208336 RepID=A0ABV0PHN6_9TELE
MPQHDLEFVRMGHQPHLNPLYCDYSNREKQTPRKERRPEYKFQKTTTILHGSGQEEKRERHDHTRKTKEVLPIL